MTTDTDSITPQERLARIVREETGGGRRVVRFFVKVTEGDLDSEGFKPNHKMDAARELVKIGLTEFEDYIVSNTTPLKKRHTPKTRRVSPNTAELSREIEQAREELARYTRELTQDGRTVIARYAEIMDGLRNDEGFQPHHRIAAGKELLLRGFGPVSSWTQPEPAQADPQITDHQPNQTNHSSDPAPQPLREAHPTLALTPTVSEYISEAVEAYEEQSPLRELLPRNILDIIDSDDPIECPCSIDEDEGREPYCPDKEGECPYYGLEWPEFSEEEQIRMREQARRGLRMRAELFDHRIATRGDP